MPGHASSPYWTAVDFDSEDERCPSNNRMYLDPWDNDAYLKMQGESPVSSEEHLNSFAGEPVSGSFYYVPTKNYDACEDRTPVKRMIPEEMVAPDYQIYGRRHSRAMVPDYHEGSLYGYGPMHEIERRRSVYCEEPMYIPHPMMYESMYGPAPVPHPGYAPSRPRVSAPRPDYLPLPPHPSYEKYRRHSRMADAYEQYPYERPEYEDWARPMPKAAPDNFHLSRYGHLQIDYSCSWNSLDRLIRNS
ncbi:uncharacterized protein LOC126967454 [Leptidea sinapis]|uniref:uncharacterized protein LOC126967454 n=1 Tax=Leptidea sinapis TaxID=189913 RepID=UPI002136B882|nr:uncharacterized protein LOC126967454 [Leptidea sinapis]